MNCDFAHHDGAYVLGSLSPADRSAFERHLADCEDCALGVRELAGLPGLLAKVSPDVLESVGAPEPVPPTLLPALVAEARHSERRRTTVLAGLAAAAALVVAGGSAVVLDVLDDPAPAGQSAPPTASPGKPMDSIDSETVTGTLALTSVAWGTRLDLECTYTPDHEAASRDATYSMVVHTSDGRVEQVATWKALARQSMRLPAATSATLADITSVEVLTSDGEPVLWLTE